jgi:cytochrome c oxidase subunit 2
MHWTPEATTFAGSSDRVFWWTVGLATLFLVGITVVMIVFVLRYDRQRHPRAAQIEGHTFLELLWTVIPLLLFLVIFYFGWTNYETTRHPPRDAMVVQVTARQWKWGFTYPNGVHTPDLYVPVNRPVKLDVVSLDVIHGFYIPSFRLKVDAVPTLTNTTWFQATRTGTYDIQCTVICGVGHSTMLSQVLVVPEADFKRWYFGPEGTPPPVPLGAQAPAPAAPEPPGLAVLRAKGCLECHSLDGSPRVGPTLKGIFGRRERVLVGGQARTRTLDEAGLRQAIQEPEKAVLEGYPPVMPPGGLEPAELAQVLAYLKTLH